MLNGLENLHGFRLPKKLWKCSKRWLKEDNPLGGVLFYKCKFLVSYTWTCNDPAGHNSNSPVTTSTGDSTEHTEDEGLGGNISALSNRKQRWQQLKLPVCTSIRKKFSLTFQPDFEEQQENNGKQEEREDGILVYDSPCDDGDNPSLEQETDFHLGRLKSAS